MVMNQTNGSNERTFRLRPTLPAAGVPNPETSAPRAITFRGFCDGSGTLFALTRFLLFDLAAVSGSALAL